MNPILKMPFFPQTHISQTFALPPLARYAYTYILLAMWVNGGRIKNTEENILSLLNLDKTDWEKIKEPVLAKLKIEGEFLTEKNLKKFYIEQKRIQKNNKTFAEKRWKDSKSKDSDYNANALRAQSPNNKNNIKYKNNYNNIKSTKETFGKYEEVYGKD